MAATVDVHEAKTHLSRLLERKGRGEEIVIAKAGRPVARPGLRGGASGTSDAWERFRKDRR